MQTSDHTVILNRDSSKSPIHSPEAYSFCHAMLHVTFDEKCAIKNNNCYESLVKPTNSSPLKCKVTITLTMHKAVCSITYLMKSTKVQNPRRIYTAYLAFYANARASCVGQKLYACALFIIDGWVTQRGPRRCRFLDPERRLFSEIATLFFERLLR